MSELDIAIKAVQRYAETHPRPVDVTQKQAAQMLKRSEPTIRKMIENGLRLHSVIKLQNNNYCSLPQAAVSASYSLPQVFKSIVVNWQALTRVS